MYRHYPDIDVLKGITILLVILGHSFCTTPINIFGMLPVMGDVVRSFQMPLFFVVSGFLFSSTGGLKLLLKKKTSRLLIPYISFGILSIILRYLFGAWTNGGEISFITSLIKLMNGEYYWFLYTLVIIMLMVQCITNRVLLYIGAFTLILLCLFTDIRSVNIMTIGKVAYYIPFFVLGFSLKDAYSIFNIKFKHSRYFLLLLFTVFFSLSFFVTEKLLVVKLYFCPIMGIFLTWIIALEIADKYEGLKKLFSHFGRYSLQYYLNHLLIMLPFYKLAGFFSNMNPLLPLLSIFICAVITSYCMLKIEQRFLFLRVMCGLK